MELILEKILEDILTIELLTGCDGALMLFNIILGTIVGTHKEGFNWKKFLFGVCKALVLAFVIAGYCAVIEFVPLILARLKISMPQEYVTFMQVVGVVLAWVYEDTMEVKEKITEVKELHYTSYDDFQIEESQPEIDGIG